MVITCLCKTTIYSKERIYFLAYHNYAEMLSTSLIELLLSVLGKNSMNLAVQFSLTPKTLDLNAE